MEDVCIPSDCSAPQGQTVDALALWDSEVTDPATGGPQILRLDQNERLVIPFTTSLLRADLHYSDFAALRGYLRCNGTGCLLCRLGRQKDVRDLLPVYDPLQRAVAILPISPSLRPQALRPAIAPVLRRLGEGPLVVSIRKDGLGFQVATQPLPAGADDGAAVIANFKACFEAGEIDLAAAFPRLANEELATIEEIRTLMAVKGLLA